MSTEQILNEYKNFLEKSKSDKQCNTVNSILREYNKFISNQKQNKVFKWHNLMTAKEIQKDIT